MLFWLFVIGLVISVICIIGGMHLDDNTVYDGEGLWGFGITFTIVFCIALLVCGGVMIANYGGADAHVAANYERYNSLTYQLENNLYDNDNDIGKKALYDEVREWNEDLAYYQAVQDSFWLGIFYPNVFDQFEFISYEQEKK